jgi:hypothetical protein
MKAYMGVNFIFMNAEYPTTFSSTQFVSFLNHSCFFFLKHWAQNFHLSQIQIISKYDDCFFVIGSLTLASLFTHSVWCYRKVPRLVLLQLPQWGKMRRDAKVTRLQAFCFSLPHVTALWTHIAFTRVLFRLCVSFCLRWIAKCLHQVLREAR